ncbi:MAG TPA: hypothetical protein PLP58_20810 [Prosthecobacter sp.]|mgnify:CR=1 FL=1|nr:hypothetical protein [Prosthecobacter sp.]
MLKVSDFTHKVADFTVKVSDFTVKVTDFTLKVSDFTVKVSDFTLKVADFTVKVSDFTLKVSDFTVKVTDFWPSAVISSKPFLGQPPREASLNPLIMSEWRLFIIFSLRKNAGAFRGMPKTLGMGRWQPACADRRPVCEGGAPSWTRHALARGRVPKAGAN